MPFCLQCRRLTRRERVLLSGLLVAGATILALWRPIGQWLLVRLLLRADAPTESVVSEAANGAKAPAVLLKQLWETGKIPHRLALLTYLKANAHTNQTLLTQTDEILLAAAQDGDFEAKELAFASLSSQGHPALLRLAKDQLSDVDPAVRVLGLKHLCRSDNPQLGALVFPLLDDPDPRVVVMAGMTLRNWFSNDFGIRMSQAAPRFDDETTHSAIPGAAEALALGVQRWKDWWKIHGSDYPNAAENAVRRASIWKLPLADFSAEGLNGERVGLSDFRGRSVLVTFWDTQTTNCFAWLSTLAEVQRRNQQRVRIVGVSLDATAPERDCAQEHEHHHRGPPHPDPAADRPRPDSTPDSRASHRAASRRRR
jgi:hypothetical protein